MEPNNEASKMLGKLGKHWFFAVESTSKTSPSDIDQFCELLEVVCTRYNLRWSQAIWKEDMMKKIGGKSDR